MLTFRNNRGEAPASVPDLYSPNEKYSYSYEYTESIAMKCKYVLEHKLGGIMFWDYGSDPTGTLLDAIDAGLGQRVGPRDERK